MTNWHPDRTHICCKITINTWLVFWLLTLKLGHHCMGNGNLCLVPIQLVWINLCQTITNFEILNTVELFASANSIKTTLWKWAEKENISKIAFFCCSKVKVKIQRSIGLPLAGVVFSPFSSFFLLFFLFYFSLWQNKSKDSALHWSPAGWGGAKCRLLWTLLPISQLIHRYVPTHLRYVRHIATHPNDM